MKAFALFLFVFPICLSQHAQSRIIPFLHDTIQLDIQDSILYWKGDSLNTEFAYEQFSTVRDTQTTTKVMSFGTCKVVIENGYIKSRTYFGRNGLKQNEFVCKPGSDYWESRMWNSDGILLSEGISTSNEESWKFYYSNGSIESEGKFVLNNPKSEFILNHCWEDLDFICKSICRHNVPDGEWRFYDINGKVKTFQFEKGRIVGMEVGDRYSK
jgi:antitoxin component YwqK of YwqJK toxin-antitoxin module